MVLDGSVSPTVARMSCSSGPTEPSVFWMSALAASSADCVPGAAIAWASRNAARIRSRTRCSSSAASCSAVLATVAGSRVGVGDARRGLWRGVRGGQRRDRRHRRLAALRGEVGRLVAGLARVDARAGRPPRGRRGRRRARRAAAASASACSRTWSCKGEIGAGAWPATWARDCDGEPSRVTLGSSTAAVPVVATTAATARPLMATGSPAQPMPLAPAPAAAPPCRRRRRRGGWRSRCPRRSRAGRARRRHRRATDRACAGRPGACPSRARRSGSHRRRADGRGRRGHAGGGGRRPTGSDGRSCTRSRGRRRRRAGRCERRRRRGGRPRWRRRGRGRSRRSSGR